MKEKEKIQFCEEDWSFVISVDPKDLLLNQYGIFLTDGYIFREDFKIFVISPKVGREINNLLFERGKNIDFQKSITQSILSKINKIDWSVDISNINYVIFKEEKYVIIRFVTIQGALELFDHINAVVKKNIFENLPPFHVTIMTRGDIKEEDLPIINTTEEILELQPKRLIL